MAATAPSVSSRGASGPLPVGPKVPATATIASTASEPVSANTSGGRGSPSPSSSPSPSPPPPGQPEAVGSSQAHRRPARPASSEFLSDKATTAFIRRSLCARHPTDKGRRSPAPIQDLLPPLTSRNDIDLQLYALISIIIREFVQNWYNKITPDETFVAEIIQVIAHCTRALEQRLRQVDLESLLFDELPELLATHVRAYRTATGQTTRPPLETDPHQIYHSLLPLPALSPVPRHGDQASIRAQADNESAYRQLLIHGVLAVLLPTEDLENECLTSLVGQILSELVIGNLVVGKLSEPWLIWELLIMTTKLIHKRDNSDHLGISHNSTAVAQGSSNMDVEATKTKRPWSLHQPFWSFLNWVFLVAGLVRLAMAMVVMSWSLPPRPNPSTVRLVKVIDRDTRQEKSQSPPPETDIDAHTQHVSTPVINFHIWQCIGDIVEVDARMPWLRGTLSMMQWVALKGPGRVAALNGTLDRLMSHYIYNHVLDPAHLPPLLRAIRAALFPNNAPGISSLRPPSSGEQLAALRRSCASALWGLLPKTVGELYYGSNNWVLFGVKDDLITNDSMNPRIGPLNSTREALHHARATHHRGSTDAGPSHLPLADGNNPGLRNDATLSSQPEGYPHSSDTLDQTFPGNDNGVEARTLSEIEAGIVDIFSDAYCNKHLIYSILELILVRLIPELTEKGVGELWEERLH